MKGLKIIRAPNRIKAEPRACAIKYLIAPSVSCRDFEIIIIGINLKRLSSRLNHKRSQWEAEIANRVLRISVLIKRGVAGVKTVIKIWAELNGSRYD